MASSRAARANQPPPHRDPGWPSNGRRHRHTRLPSPWSSIRWTTDSAPHFWMVGTAIPLANGVAGIMPILETNKKPTGWPRATRYRVRLRRLILAILAPCFCHGDSLSLEGCGGATDYVSRRPDLQFGRGDLTCVPVRSACLMGLIAALPRSRNFYGLGRICSPRTVSARLRYPSPPRSEGGPLCGHTPPPSSCGPSPAMVVPRSDAVKPRPSGANYLRQRPGPAASNVRQCAAGAICCVA
jgi:hypothetical protein